MKKHTLPIRVLDLIIVLSIIAAFLFAANRIMLRTDASWEYQPYVEDHEDTDVIFLGASIVETGVHPYQLWRDYGITSYNFGTGGFGIKYSYWMFRLSLQYHVPKVAVLDCLGLARTSDNICPVSMLHNGFDIFPLNSEKIRSSIDMCPTFSDRMQLLLPLMVYHTRWSEMTGEDLFGEKEYNQQRGAVFYHGWHASVPQAQLSRDDVLDLNENREGMVYIRKFIELCREYDIQPVLMFMPFEAQIERQQEANTAALLAEEEGVPYLNMLYEDIIDVNTDACDSNAHLNRAGATKVTDYLGKTLTQLCGLEDHRSDPAYAHWYEGYDIYWNNVILKDMEEEEDFKTLITMLYDTDLGAYFETFNNYQFDENETALMNQLPYLFGVGAGDPINNTNDADVRVHIYSRVTGEELFIKEFNHGWDETVPKY